MVKRKFKSIYSVFILFAVIILFVLGLMFLNYLPNPLDPNVAPEYPEANLLAEGSDVSSDMRKITDVIQGSSDIIPDNFENKIDDLNVNVYGVDEASSSSVISWYKEKNSKDGWSVVNYDPGLDFDGEICVWSKGLMGQVVVTIDNDFVIPEQYQNETVESLIESLDLETDIIAMMDYDVVVATSTAPLTTYLDLM